MSEERIRGDLTKVWLKRAASEVGDLPRRALIATAYWAGYASSCWHLGRARGQRALPPALTVIDGGRDRRERAGTVACVNLLMMHRWTGDLFIERFQSGYVAQLQLLDGFRQAVLARDQRNPDLYVTTTFWDSLAQAQAVPEFPQDMQELLLTRSKMFEIVGRWVRPSWNGIERRREERRRGRERRQAVAVG